MSTTENTTNNSTLNASISANIYARVPEGLGAHIENFNNPHAVTCEQIGAMPYSENIVEDEAYNHTDNNFSNDDKSHLDTLYEKIESINKIDDIKSQTDTNTTNIDNYNNVINSKISITLVYSNNVMNDII